MSELRTPKVLVADDDLDLATVCSLVLETEGYDTVVAANGADACRSLDKEGADVLLLDVNMPVMDGLAVCDRVKHDPKTSGLPVIMMSASEELVKEASKTCADAVLQKPFDINDLLSTVGRLVYASR